MILKKASYELKNLIIDFKNEFTEYGEKTIPGSELLDKIDSFDDWIEYVQLNSNESTVSSDWVITTVYFAIINSEIVGVISLRHYLNDYLIDWGHIGYSIRPSQRNKGYGNFMFKKILSYAKQLNMMSLSISSYSDNKASINLILKNNGVFERKYKYLDKWVYIYTIYLK